MSTLSLNKDRPDFENGAVGTQNDARLALYEQIADQGENLRSDDLQDITDEMFLNPVGTGDEDQGDGSEGDSLDAQDAGESVEGSGDIEADISDVPVLPKLKVNGQDVEITPELIAHAQKVVAADNYLAEASRLYKSASTVNEPSPDVQADDAALARAIQMGSEEEAIAAIQKIRQSTLPAGEIEAIVDRKLATRDTQSDADRFKSTYKDLLANEAAQEAVWAFDTLYANDGEPATFDRFEKAAKKVMELRGVTGLEDKQARKDNARRPVLANGGRLTPQQPEREPTVREEIAAMAKSRGQQNYAAGN